RMASAREGLPRLHRALPRERAHPSASPHASEHLVGETDELVHAAQRMERQRAQRLELARAPAMHEMDLSQTLAAGFGPCSGALAAMQAAAAIGGRRLAAAAARARARPSARRQAEIARRVAVAQPAEAGGGGKRGGSANVERWIRFGHWHTLLACWISA